MPAPSLRSGMGAIPYAGGVAFRVWAPFAVSVSVAGGFNAWSDSAQTLAPESASGYWSADVEGAVAGQEYRFVIRSGGDPLWRIDPRARQTTNSAGNAVIYNPDFPWSGERFQMPARNSLVACEIHIGTFNDQILGKPGTFDTAIEKLPYLRDLGINAISVMPIAEFPGDLSWGYDPSDPFSVESAYGGPDGFKRLVDAAHTQGIAVVLDVVYNHFGPGDLSLWQFDGWNQNGMGGIYFYEDWRSQTPWGARPDYGRGEVRQYIRDNALMWLEEFQADGLRIDSTSYVRNVNGNNNSPGDDLPDGWSLLQWINDEIRARQPWKLTVAEDLQNNEWLTKPTGAGGAGCGAQWDAGFVNPVRAAIIVPGDDDRDVNSVSDAITHRYDSDAYTRIIYTESHDNARRGQARVPEAIWPGNSGNYFAKKRSTLGAALTLTAPGVPMLLQGQEFLEDGYFDDSNPVDWSELAHFSGMHDLYRDLIRLRRNWYDNTRGLQGQNVHVFQAGQGDKMIAFHRWDQGGAGDDVIVLLNLRDRGYGAYTIGFPLPGLWRVRFNSDYAGYSADFGNWSSNDTLAVRGACQNMPCQGSVGIGPYTAIILSQ